MLDFCYYCQIVTMFCLYVLPQNTNFFKLTFALKSVPFTSNPFFVSSFYSHGPLLMAVVAWKNTLVFHDLDKVTSLFIHIYPPIGTYTHNAHPFSIMLITLWQSCFVKGGTLVKRNWRLSAEAKI